MKTYTEKEGREKFDWFEWLERLKSVEKLEEYPLQDIEEKAESAQSWVTCAVGNQCDIIPRDNGGAPRDFKLSCLGCRFAENMGMIEANFIRKDFEGVRDDIEVALDTLRKIEERSSELIQEIRKMG